MRRRLSRLSAPPETLGDGRYEVRDLLGSGGMATVYRALDNKNGRVVALKILLPHAAESTKTRERFLREAQTMSDLDHPNIAGIIEVGEDSGRTYFVMEFYSGGNLARHLRRYGQQGACEALGFIFQVLQGLDYAHGRGVVHRDVKPHNMLLEDRIVKLTDFGIARTFAMEQSPRITGTGDTLGTLAYMSPEQRVDPRKAGPTADLYGVGATLYMLVTGRRPFELAMMSLDPSVIQRLPHALRGLIRCSTAHRPSDRYQSARAMAVAAAEAWEVCAPERSTAERMEAFDQLASSHA